MARVSKRERKQVLKSFNEMINGSSNISNTSNKWKRPTQAQIQSLERIHLEPDEFTQHVSLKKTLQDFVLNAQNLETSYQAHRKNMIRTVALELEDKLKEIDKPELICRISEELINILKQAGVKWNPIYLRRCLDQRYKDPTNRANALARKMHPGVPQDTGKTAEELEASLNRKPTAIVGKYTVYAELEIDDGKTKIFRFKDDNDTNPMECPFLPVIVHVDALNQTAEVELDEEDHNFLVEETEKASKSEEEQKTNPNPESKPKRFKTKKQS